MKWTKEKNPINLIENAVDTDGTLYQIRTQKGRKLWQVYKNGALFNDGWYTRHNAKAQVDATLQATPDNRQFNTGRPPESNSVRRTKKQIEMGKETYCYKCNSTDRTGAVVEFNCTEIESKKFSLCSHCLSLLIPFFTPYQPPVTGNWNEPPYIPAVEPDVAAAIDRLAAESRQ